MKSKLLFILSLFITTISAQQTYDLPWTTNGSSANQQLSIDVGDTVRWTWDSMGHNLVQLNGETEPGFGEGYVQSPGHQYSHTFTTVGAHDYHCGPHPNSMYGTVTVNDSSASVGDYENYSFSIYPNPSSDYVKITLPQLNETANIQVFDMLGKMNFSDTSDDLNNYKLDVSNYRAGVYFVTISTNNIRVSNKFIKL